MKAFLRKQFRQQTVLGRPKQRPCVQTRKIAANANFRLGPARAAAAKSMTPTSNTFVQMVTPRLLNRSARYPPVSEKRRRGREEHAD